MRLIFDRSRPAYIPTHRAEVHIPFKGDPKVFDFRPSQFTSNPPYGDVSGHDVVIVVEHPADSANVDQMRQQSTTPRSAFADSSVRRCSCEAFNQNLAAIVSAALGSTASARGQCANA